MAARLATPAAAQAGVAASRASRHSEHVPFMSEGLTVDRAVDRPLYLQVSDAINDQIDGRSLLPGEALLSEAELQRVFGVARSVVRQALAQLVDHGAVQRSQGRISIVAPASAWRRQVQQAGGFTEQLATQGQTLTTRLLEFAAGTAPEQARSGLGTTVAWRVERVRSVDDVPVAFVRNWVPRELFPTLTAADLTDGSLHEFMRAHDHPPAGGPRQVQAVPADQFLGSMLRVPVGSPLLLLEGTTCDAAGRGLEWFSVWHHGHTVFDVDTAAPATLSSAGDLTGVRRTMQRLRSELAELDAELRRVDGRGL